MATADTIQMSDDNVNVPEANPTTHTIDGLWMTVYRDRLMSFLLEYGKNNEIQEEGAAPRSKYENRALEIIRYGSTALLIDMCDLETGPALHAELAAFLKMHFLHIWRGVDAMCNEFIRTCLNMYLTRLQQSELHSEAMYEAVHNNSYHVVIKMDGPTINIRGVRCEQLGQLTRLRGTATRVSDIRPELRTASFSCNELLDSENGHELIPRLAESPVSLTRGSHVRDTALLYVVRRFQENSSEIPAGSMPRAMDVILHRSLCERIKPGDRATVTGCLAAIPDVQTLMRPGEVPKSVQMDRNRGFGRTENGEADSGVTGWKKIGVRDLTYRLVFMAVDVATANHNQYADAVLDGGDVNLKAAESLETIMQNLGLTVQEQELFQTIAASEDTLGKLAECFAPAIFGCDHIKKGILLMIAGGVTKRTGTEGLRLRGDINVCIVGDPGTAKSQLLKFVRRFAPRAVYTSGNTSSAAGLTVSVVKDVDQGGSVIEAGALMLADTGICCIDEFEKMNVKDMVAIHEAVEQQTISICKSGVHATLNARASLLAACNPRFSHYDPAKPFRHNVRLSAPIISRFDLFFTMLDVTDFDEGVAWHIINQHANPGASNATHGMLTEEQLKKYISLLVRSYVDLRSEGVKPGGSRSARVTVRSLESLIRLSEAVAKLKLVEEVTEAHVRTAIRVMQSSLIKLRRNKLVLSEGDDQEETVEIDADVYDQISTTVIARFREAEADVRVALKGPTEVIIPKDEVIGWYLENFTDETTLEKEADLRNEYRKIECVVNRMVLHDMSLIEELRDVEDGDEGLDVAERTKTLTLRLHPNYSADVMEISKAGGHATLPVDFYFTEGVVPEATNPTESQTTNDGTAWLGTDDDFIAQIYGWGPNNVENDNATSVEQNEPAVMDQV